MNSKDNNEANEKSATNISMQADIIDPFTIDTKAIMGDYPDALVSRPADSTEVHVEFKPNDDCLNLDEPSIKVNDGTKLIQLDDDSTSKLTLEISTKQLEQANSSVTLSHAGSIEPQMSNESTGSISIDNLSAPLHVRSNPGDSKRVKFKKNILTSSTLTNDPNSENNTRDAIQEITISGSTSNSDLQRFTTTNQYSDQSTRKISDEVQHVDDLNLEHIELNESSACLNDYDDGEVEIFNRERELESRLTNNKHSSNLRKPSYVKRIYNRLTNINLLTSNNTDQVYKYSRYEDEDLIKASGKYNTSSDKIKTSRTFRGSYKYSRAEVSMAIFRKTINLLSHRSTFALFGAFLIHVTLGTVYTLSNVNSYMTSYMRKNGSPNATYGAAVWLSSSYSVGQGVSMVLGGYLEKRFSARLSCIIGCAIHSISIMSTSWTIDNGILAVLLSYGILPGFGCGLAYMTPMSNGFAWFPNRRGLVAGVILAGFGIGTFVFNMAQTGFVNPSNLSPHPGDNGYFTQDEVLNRVPQLFIFLGCIYAIMQLIGCSLLFPPPKNFVSDERPIFGEHTELNIRSAIKTTEFRVLFVVYGLTTQGVLFINSILKEYGQIFIRDDSYLAWVGSMASIANSLGRLVWGLAIDKYSFTFCFTSITLIFGTGLFLTPFEFILSNKLMYLLCTLIMFGSFSGWMSSYPVHLSRVFGRTNSGMIYGLIYISQAVGGIITAFGTHYLIDNYNRFVPFYCICSLELLGLIIYLLFYPKA